MERLRKEGSKLVYRCAKQRSEPTSDKRGAKVDELHLTPLELICVFRTNVTGDFGIVTEDSGPS